MSKSAADSYIELTGGQKGTATMLYDGEDGSLVIEFYDHSASAEAFFGRDVALLIHVAPEHRGRMLDLLGRPADCAEADDGAALYTRLQERFADYFQIKAWLETEGIPFRTSFDPWA